MKVCAQLSINCAYFRVERRLVIIFDIFFKRKFELENAWKHWANLTNAVR
jgi:hypothetical protein